MTRLGVEVSDKTMVALEKKALRLAELVDLATSAASDKKVRDGGAQLVERLGEWMDEIKDLREVGDEDVHEKIRSFAIRLHLAEEKTKSWPIPKKQREKILSGTKRRRGRPKKVRSAA